MNISDRKFSAEALRNINNADDLKIAPFRPDGRTYGTPTWIWEVVVNEDLYVRAYNGVNSRWYQSAIKQKSGRIYAAGEAWEVYFEPLQDEGLNVEIDEAYKKKYRNSPYLASMISGRARVATIKIIPKQ